MCHLINIAFSKRQKEIISTSSFSHTFLYCCIRTKYANYIHNSSYGPLTRYVKLRVAHVPGMPGTFSPPSTSKETASLRSRTHHGTCATHVPWCMSGSLTRCGGENVPGIPGACATRIWQEAHDNVTHYLKYVILVSVNYFFDVPVQQSVSRHEKHKYNRYASTNKLALYKSHR